MIIYLKHLSIFGSPDLHFFVHECEPASRFFGFVIYFTRYFWHVVKSQQIIIYSINNLKKYNFARSSKKNIILQEAQKNIILKKNIILQEAQKNIILQEAQKNIILQEAQKKI